MKPTRWEALTSNFQKLQTVTIPFNLIGHSIRFMDQKIESLVYNCAKPVGANVCMTALRATPMFVGAQHYPGPTQALGGAVAVYMALNQQPPSDKVTPTLKAAHALSLAFFMNLTVDIFQAPSVSTAFSSKTLIDAALLMAFMGLANKTEASI